MTGSDSEWLHQESDMLEEQPLVMMLSNWLHFAFGTHTHTNTFLRWFRIVCVILIECLPLKYPQVILMRMESNANIYCGRK